MGDQGRNNSGKTTDIRHVLLVYAPTYNEMKFYLPRVLRHSHTVVPPISIAYLAAYLRRELPELQIDAVDAEMTRDWNLVRQYFEQNRFDVIGVSTFTTNLFDSLRILKIAAEVRPEATRLLGGFHMMHYAEETMTHNCIDFAFQGDSEESLALFLRKLGRNDDVRDVPGLVYRDGETVRINPQQAGGDLDDLPFPEFPELLAGRYYSFVDAERAVPIMTSRGCPFSCTYCSSQPFKMRKRSIANVLDEMEFRKQQGARLINVWDESINFQPGRIKELCRGILDRGLDIQFTGRARPDFIDEEDVRLLAKAGCSRISFGIDVTPEEVSRRYNRPIKLDHAQDVMHWCTRHGLRHSANFLLGLEYDAESDTRQRIAHSLTYDVDLIQYNLLYYLPGTKIYNDYVEASGTDPFRDYVLRPKEDVHLPLCNSRMTVRRRIWLARMAFLKAYLSPKGLLRQLSRNRYTRERPWEAAKAALSMLWFIIKRPTGKQVAELSVKRISVK